MKNFSNQKGLSIITVAISLIIFGLIFVALLRGYDIWIEKKRHDVTEERIIHINAALELFVKAHSRLPCAARINEPVDTKDFGTETDCTAGAILGSTFEDDAGDGPVRIGAVPVRSLNLPDEYAADSWGHRYIYAVSTLMAQTPAGYKDNLGSITLQDPNGYSLTNPRGRGLYVIVSTGPTGVGAYEQLTGAIFKKCEKNIPDGENCDNDAVFADTLNYSEAAGKARFDDYVFFRHKDFVELPAISQYRLVTLPCPDQAVPPNLYGEHCATVQAPGRDANIDVVGGEEPSDGVLLYSGTFPSQTNGRLVVRANIPITYDNPDLTLPGNFNDALMGAIYIDGVLSSRSLLIKPTYNFDEPEGYSGMMIADKNGIVDGTPYQVEIYVFSLGNSGTTATFWAGSMKHTDHRADAVIEFLEINDL